MSRYLAVTLVIALLAVPGSVAFWWQYFDVGHAPVEKLSGLYGQSLEAVVSALGEPTSSVEFPMRDCAGELRVELFNVYPPHDPASADVRIKELVWRHRWYSVAVWFHQVRGRWVALDSCRWRAGFEF